MAESAFNDVLHKYSAQNEYVQPLSDFSENVLSSPDNTKPDGLSGDGYHNFGDTPNNNVMSGDSDSCLMDNCVNNSSSSAPKVFTNVCGLESNSSSQESTSNHPPDNYDYKLQKQLFVKLETPNFQHHLSPKNDHLESSTTTTAAVAGPEKFHSVGDAKNGAIKKKRKTKNNSVTAVKKQQRIGAGRGRPPKRPLIATYHSQISGDKNTIKIRIKKAHLTAQVTPVKKPRQRKKQKKDASDTDVSDYEDSTKRVRFDLPPQAQPSDEHRPESPTEQSVWGHTIPETCLIKIFQNVCYDQGALPLLVNLCRVCKLWRQVAITPQLWENIDLSSTVKDRAKTDFKLQWLIQNRLVRCRDLNLSDWKIKNIPSILEELAENCPELRGLNLSGWSGLTADHLKTLTTCCSKLERLDLSSINGSNMSTKSALNASPLVGLAQTMGGRLTHLVLAHNKLAGFSQILTAISAHCPNLQLLDLSNIKTHAYNSSLLHVEKLQEGCPKIRVLRVTNSQILLAPTTLTAQMASPGFPDLEELSLAGIEDDQTTSKFIDDNGIERILKSSHKLRLLDVRGCTKITDSGLVKVPAWDLEHLFLSACYVTRLTHSGLELIIQKWSHSLVEVDLAWSTATEPLDAAVLAFAEKGSESPLRILNLCGSSVSLESVKAVLVKCPQIQSINLQSCRALPRGIKRLYEGAAVAELRASLENKPKSEDLDSTGSEEPVENAENRGTNATTPADHLD